MDKKISNTVRDLIDDRVRGGGKSLLDNMRNYMATKAAPPDPHGQMSRRKLYATRPMNARGASADGASSSVSMVWGRS